MKRLAILAVVAVLAACGSDSSGPTDTFTGTWNGIVISDPTDTLHFQMISGQSGSTLNGNGHVSAGDDVKAFTFTGTSTPPTIALSIIYGTDTLTYTGSYVTQDSVAGFVTESGSSFTLDLRKQ